MFPKKGPDITPLKEQLKAISTIELISSTKNVLEKFLWFFIALGGTIYISKVFINQLNYWVENPILVTKGSMPLTDAHLPAVTFCHKGMQKYALVERLVNFIDPGKNVPKEIVEIRNEAIKAQLMKINKDLPDVEICALQKAMNGSWVQKSELELDDCKVNISVLFHCAAHSYIWMC